METILSAIKTWTKKEIKNSTADWNQNDSTMSNYIKNRTHWKEETIVTYLNKQTINLTNPCTNYGTPEGWYYEYCDNLHIKDLKIGEEYTIIVDGIAYTETARSVENGICFGKELPYYWEEKPNVPYGIFVHISNNVPLFSAFGLGNHTFEIYQNKTIAHQIDPKYIPSLVVNIAGNEEDGFVADKTSAEIYKAYKNGLEVMAKAWEGVQYSLYFCDEYEAVFIALNAGEGYHYQDAFIIVNDQVEYQWEEGYGFVSEYLNNLSNFIPEPSEEDAGKYLRGDGTWSDELVTDLTTKMDKNNPVGTGSFSMNRKADTTVGNCSHAEGKDTTASGQASHAEGYYTKATNSFAHAEGTNTTASGQHSHAEGNNTIASGFSSHAEGRGTVAQRKTQHVQGEYNILDTTGSTTTTEGKYAHIVGNGDSDTARSNAHTLDWEGNAWYSGDVYVGSTSGTNRDDGSLRLLKMSDKATDDDALNLMMELGYLPALMTTSNDIIYTNSDGVIYTL